MSQKNDPDLFPNLNLKVAKSFAYTWATYFTFMDRIILYRPSVLEYSIKYILYFELSEISDAEGFGERDKGFINSLQSHDALMSLGIGDKFKDVYITNPSNNFFQEWMFTTQIPEYVDQKNKWVLFKKKGPIAILSKRKPRPAQKHRNEARKIAAKIWGEDPTITIADMMKKEPILEVTKRTDGKYYVEKTVRKWINDLCPDRSPGRRQSKT